MTAAGWAPRAAMLLVITVVVTGCASVLRRDFAGLRQAEYVASNPELPPKIAEAIEAGHVLLGMSTKQVWVVLGDPVRKTRFDRSVTEIWLYKAARIHQNHYWLGNQDVRLVFVKDLLIAIEPM